MENPSPSFVPGLQLLLALPLAWLPLAATDSPAPDAYAPPTFSAPDLVEVGNSFDLALHSPPSEVKNWIVQWGDGTNSTENAASTSVHHIYKQPGYYSVKVAATPAGGNPTTAVFDYSQLILDDKPTAYYRFGTSITGHAPDAAPVSDDSLNSAPSATASGLPWGGTCASFDQANALLSPVPASSSDRFSVDFWLRSRDVATRQDVLSSASTDGSQLYLADGKINLELPRGAVFSQPLPGNVANGAWHHFAVVYDRAPLFPFQNSACFYVDGVLQGNVHLDLYDTGTVAFPGGMLGGAPDGMHRLKGSLAEFALYSRLLPPHRILKHFDAYLDPQTEGIMAAPRTVEPFTVDEPHLLQTINVPLDPAPDVDNGPVLRAAINNATPGTRLVLVNTQTKSPGGSFHINTLDEGHDWAALRLMGKRDFEIDGGGATLIFGVANRQFFIRNCQRMALRNFSVDLDPAQFRVGVYVRILDLDPDTGEVRFQFVNGRNMSPDMTVPSSISMWRWRPHDPKTLRITKGPFFETGQAFLRTPKRDPNNPSILIGQIKPGLIRDLEAYRQGPNLFMINNARFENTSVELGESEHVTFDRVNYYATLGMVFLSAEENHIRIMHCKIGLPPGLTAADRPLASGADGYHFHQTQGDVLFENNEIALTDDDPITIKDTVLRNISAVDQETLKLPDDVSVGDEIRLYNWDFSPIDYRGHIVVLDRGNAQMDQALPVDLPTTFTAMDLRHHTNNWIIRNNDLHDYYGRLLLCTAHGSITGNVIQHSWLHLGASNANFDSAGISSFVTVYNNLLVDTAADTGIWGSGSSYPVFQAITFFENSFVGQNLHLGNAGSPWVVGNYFERREEGLNAISVDQSISPSILGNVQLIGQPGTFTLVTKDTSGLTDEANATLVSPAKSNATY